ncbi:MAG: formylglycine-generating enzyme family protein [SAR324 cluster bacterium]|nr:formylglycine-generating enzyme family protein [SAR324 cluster bacterium]
MKKRRLLTLTGLILLVGLLWDSCVWAKPCEDDPFTEADERIACEGKLKVANALTNSIGMKFIQIQAGSFIMGDNEYYAKPAHQVTISRSFYMGMYEVTQEQWYKVMSNNPSFHKTEKVGMNSRNHPVETVSWNDAQEFIQKLNQKENTKKYRLCTEAEWEYAARAGTTTGWACGNSESCLGDYGWYDTNAGNVTHPVGQKLPNAWGLYDMHGNVWEWVQDWYGDYTSGSTKDPRGPNSGSFRVSRGGGFYFNADYARSAGRNSVVPSYRHGNSGFRLCQ